MQAIVYYRYGSPDVLQCEEIDKPTPAADEVLLKVHAASVNPLDWHYLRGTPRLMRMIAGLRKPKDRRLGVDVAGVVETVGRKVTEFKPGDEVFGVCRGAFAEYACAAESGIVHKPARLTFEQAAAVNVAAQTALQSLRDHGRVQPGQKVLIIGAGGGVGTFAVQIAKALGAHVTGVCSTQNVDLVRSLGAEHVIDYTKEEVTGRYDLILDNVGTLPLRELRRALAPKGTYLMIGAPSGNWIAPLPRLLRARLLSLFVSQSLKMALARSNKADLLAIKQLIEDGKVTPVVGRTYPLCETAEAVRYVEAGHARGKVVITTSRP